MTHESTLRSRWFLRFAAIGWFVAGLALLLALPILIQATGWALPAVVLVAALLALPCAWIFRKLLGSKKSFAHSWFKWAAALLCLLSALLAAPIYYLAAVTQMRPALAPQVTLTNGDKTIVFQGMQHVGAERFYKSVVYDLEDALSRGYVLYYEGVRPSTPEADAWLNRTVTGGRDLGDSYRAVGGLCGLQFQNDYFQLLGRDAQAHPESHVVADVSTLEMKQEYERLAASDSGFAKAMAARPKSDASSPGTMESAIRFFKQGSDGQRALGGILCRGFMTLSLGRAATARSDDPLDRVLIDFRNRQLAARLLAEPRPHIYLTYGSMHLPGVFALLRKNDPKWHVASVKWMRTIDAPEEYDGQLPDLGAGGIQGRRRR